METDAVKTETVAEQVLTFPARMPAGLVSKIDAMAQRERRSRNAQLIWIAERFFREEAEADTSAVA